MTRFHNLAYDSSDKNICTMNVIIINDRVNNFLVKTIRFREGYERLR